MLRVGTTIHIDYQPIALHNQRGNLHAITRTRGLTLLVQHVAVFFRPWRQRSVSLCTSGGGAARSIAT